MNEPLSVAPRNAAVPLTIGVHWGGNVVYRFYDGFDGQGGLFSLVKSPGAAWQEWVSMGAAAVALAALFVLFRFTVRSEREGPLTARG